MKICPKCNQQYEDANLNFCLSDGELLMEQSAAPEADADATPTVFLDAPRVTNQNLEEPQQQHSQQPFGGVGMGSQPTNQDQAIYQQQFNPPQQYPMIISKDKTLPTVSLVTGILGLLLFCCYGGIPFGSAALITGYLGIRNINSDSQAYGGKELAIVGMVLGGISLALSLILIIINLIGLAFG